MSFSSRKLLGMLVGPTRIELALVSTGRGGRVLRQAAFEFPQGLSWEKPQALGKAVAAFLREHQMHAKQVVAALPGRWTLVKARTLPPCNEASAAAVLRLAIEREYQASARDWAFDFLMHKTDEKGTHVLLAAAPRNRLAQLSQMLQAAELSMAAAVPATATLAMAQPAVAGDWAALYVSGQGSELVMGKQGCLMAVQQLVSSHGSAGLAGEITRTLAVHGLTPGELSVTSLQPGVAAQSLSDLRVNDTAPAEVHNVAPALAAGLIAQRWAASPAATLDVSHSRVAAPAASRFTRAHRIGALLAAILVLGAGYFGVDWYMQWKDVDALQREMELVRPELRTARANVERLTHARGWYDNRPRILDGMRDLTMAFPTDGSVWSTSIIMRDDMTATLAGKAVDERAAIGLIEKLRASEGFSDVKMLYLRQADRSGRTVSFALNFSYESVK